MRWISTSINCLLPVAQVGGDFVRARLLAQSGTPGPTAGASVVVDATAGLLTQLAFALLGVVLLLRQLGHASELAPLAAGLVLFGLLLFGFAAVSAAACSRCWPGRCTGSPAARLAGPDRQRRRARCRGQRLLPGPARALARCAAWRWLAWLAGGIEVWLAFLVLGRPVELTEAIILESLGQVVRSAGFVIPGGLGLQESGILAAGIWLGLPAGDRAFGGVAQTRARGRASVCRRWSSGPASSGPGRRSRLSRPGRVSGHGSLSNPDRLAKMTSGRLEHLVLYNRSQ